MSREPREHDDVMTALVSLLIAGVCLALAYRQDDGGAAAILAVTAVAAAVNAIRVSGRGPR